MAGTDYKIAGQVCPAANTVSLLYTVPVGKQFVASSINITNMNLIPGPDETFSIAIVPAGETLSDKCYVEFEEFIKPRKTINLLRGFTLGPLDMVYVKSSNSTMAFSLFGAEITPVTGD